ncbi:MAG: ABC transporter permease [Propionibacteriaceae bacterium]|nr:ABC transporter permease [Propionibacteriaceae bacterium]
MNVSRSSHRWFGQVWGLLILQLSNWRWSWPQILLTGLLVPLMSLLGISYLAHQAGNGDALVYAVSGAITMALSFESQNKVSANYAYLKANGALEFYSSLPVRKWHFILATSLIFSLFSVPSLLVILLVSWLFLQVTLVLSPLTLLAAILCIFPFVSVGALIGNLSASPEQASSISLAATLATSAVGPVAVSPDLLPDWFNRLGMFNPGYHVAELVRAGFLGEFDDTLGVSVVVVCVLAVGMSALAAQVMRWGKE